MSINSLWSPMNISGVICCKDYNIAGSWLQFEVDEMEKPPKNVVEQCTLIRWYSDPLQPLTTTLQIY